MVTRIRPPTDAAGCMDHSCRNSARSGSEKTGAVSAFPLAASLNGDAAFIIPRFLSDWKKRQGSFHITHPSSASGLREAGCRARTSREGEEKHARQMPPGFQEIRSLTGPIAMSGKQAKPALELRCHEQSSLAPSTPSGASRQTRCPLPAFPLGSRVSRNFSNQLENYDAP